MTITANDQAVTTGLLGSFNWAMGKGSVSGFYYSQVCLTVPSSEALFDPTTLMPASGGSVTAMCSGAITNPTSVLTRPANTTAYAANQLIASSTTAGSVVVPSFAIATSAGGVILPRVRVLTNATSGWGGVNLSVNLWSAAPTYLSGDGSPYTVATGSKAWLANFLISLVQFGDGAAGAGGLTGANEMALKLASGTAVYADIQILSQATPNASQTFTVIPELLN
jgi:hypothetical protein